MTKLPINIQANRKIIAFTPDGNLEQVENLNTVYPANTYFYVPGNISYTKTEPKLYLTKSWFSALDTPNPFWNSYYVPRDSLPKRLQAWKVLLDLD